MENNKTPQWEKEYCKKFGLCENQPKHSKCQCRKEIAFIKSTLEEVIEKIHPEHDRLEMDKGCDALEAKQAQLRKEFGL